MQIIGSILLLVGIWAYVKWNEGQASNHSKTHVIDYGKVNNDRLFNNLSETQINKNIANGKYDTGERIKSAEEIRAEQKVKWEQYKKDNPWMPLN